MPTRHAGATWDGTLRDGNGSVRVESGTFDAAYSFTSRFEEGSGTNPEELIGAAEAGCVTMALSLELAEAGYTPERINTEADVTLEAVDGDFAITGITLNTSARVPGIGNDEFQRIAEAVRASCPVSKALCGTSITLTAALE